VLAERGYRNLIAGIVRNHGFPAIRKLLGQEQPTRPANTWKDQAYTVAQAQEILRKEGWTELPGERILREKGYCAFTNGVTRYHGMGEIRRMLGHGQRRRENGLWITLEYTLAQARDAMQKERWQILPGQRALVREGYSMLAQAIMNYHGGFAKVRKLLGQKDIKREDGIWKDLSFVLNEARKAMEHEGWQALPSRDTLTRAGYGALASAIRKYHGGYTVIRAKLHAALGRDPAKDQLEELLKRYAGGA
jgi:hypothetical protein